MALDHDRAASGTPVALVGLQPDALRPTRVLLGWLEDHEAVQHMLGGNPSPGDDLTAITAQIVSAQRAVRERPTTEPQPAIVDGDRALLDELAGRPDVQGAFAGLQWTVEWVDLSRVQPVQKFVFTDGPDSRSTAAATGGPTELAELCFPSVQEDPIRCQVDPDGLGFTFSSHNPNLQVRSLPPQPMLIGSMPMQQQLVGIPTAIGIGPGHINIAHFQDRYILRDGTHRAAGLLRRAVSIIPAVVIEAPSWQIVAPRAGLFDQNLATGDRPPLLTDCWAPDVSADGLQPRTQTHWRFRPERLDLPA